MMWVFVVNIPCTYRGPKTESYGFLSSQRKICAQGMPVTTSLPNVHQEMESSVAVVAMATLSPASVTGSALVRVRNV